MIPLADHYFVYAGKINNPNIAEIHCALCNSARHRVCSRQIDTVGWVCFKKGNVVQERYCPTCSSKVWPRLHAQAMTLIEHWPLYARTVWPEAFARALAEMRR